MYNSYAGSKDVWDCEVENLIQQHAPVALCRVKSSCGRFYERGGRHVSLPMPLKQV